jgi:hypothetical protein
MAGSPVTEKAAPRRLPATAVAHQEGAIGLVAVLWLLLSERELALALSPRGAISWVVLAGLGIGVAVAGGQWLLRGTAPLRRLEACLRELVGHWSLSECLAIAVISGVAEEALLRAALQPVVGLLPAAGLFALLHIFPDRRAWAWPILAFVIGLAMGVLFESFGYPAAALAHVTINAVGLARLSRPSLASAEPDEG